MTEHRSAIVVAVPEAGPAVEAWRERTCADKPSRGIPAHITILFPFVPAEALDDHAIGNLGALLARFESFRFTLEAVGRFPGVLYLAPAPREPFDAFIGAVLDAYPEYPPYGGEIPRDSIVPHLTVAHGDEELLRRAEREISPGLPIASLAREVLVLEEVEPDWGLWRIRARLPLGLTAGGRT